MLTIFSQVTKLFGTNYADFTDSTQQLALFQFYEMRLRDSSGAFVGDSSATATPAWSNVVTPDEESGRRVRCAGSAELAPTYSEALLLLDDVDTTAYAEAPETTPAASPSVIQVSAPSVYPTAATRANVVDDEDADEDDVFAVAMLSSENPPSYEEALCFPVVDSVTATEVAATHFQVDVDSPNRRMQQRCDTRLPNSRTFLSIETSL